MEKLKVSAAIIARNEEKKIARCLESLGWADEVVVIDGFSTDATVEIAVCHGAKVIQRKFTGSFADDRNAAMANARYDWVLHLDADDVVTAGFVSELTKKLRSNEDFVAYKFRRKSFFLGHSMDHGGWHHYIPNLVNKKYVRYEGKVHEMPVYKGNLGTIEGDIEHYPFDSLEQFITRHNRYTGIAAQELFDKNGALPESEIRKQMVNKTISLFWKSYIKKKGYRGGLHGLIFAVLFAFGNFLKWAKFWEICKREEK